MLTSIDHPPRLVTLPGLHGSEPAHWQSWLETQFPDSVRVHQDDWDDPELHRWTHAAVSVFTRLDRPYLIAAHSFGCLTAVQALLSDFPNIVGALLVAPASPSKFDIQSLNRRRLPVPSVVVASDSDPWMSALEARDLAQDWGSAFINLGDAGHINVASGYGPFALAKELTDTLFASRVPVE